VIAALYGLAERCDVKGVVVADAIDRYGIDTEVRPEGCVMSVPTHRPEERGPLHD
jgi:pyruvate dehydrogenase complex dehydrogenase (E1) component